MIGTLELDGFASQTIAFVLQSLALLFPVRNEVKIMAIITLLEIS
jgi:hypothetical protein